MAVRTTRFFARSLLALALCAGGAVAVSTPVASAQQIAIGSDVNFGGMGGLAAPIGKSDVDQMAKLLNFNSDQVASAKLLLDTYLSEHNKRADVMRAEQEKARTAFREDRDFSAFGDLGTKMEAFAKDSEAKEKELLENIKSLLEPKQADQWPVWERAHRRAGSMNRGMLIGERADLIQLVERLNLPAPAQTAVAPTLEAYSIALDRVIVARDEAQKAFAEEGKKMRDDIQKNGMGGVNMMEMMKKADEMMKKGRQASGPVRDVNRSFARQIEGTLSGVDPALGEKFADAVRRANFPDIYRERYIDKALAAAAAMEGLEKSQQEGVAALKSQLAVDRRPVDAALEKAAEDDEANFSLEGMMNGGGMGRLMGGSEATQAARKARRELDSSVLEKLKALLGEERAAKLPDRSAETPENPFGGMSGPGGGMRLMTR